jgi:hypothetical protein
VSCESTSVVLSSNDQQEIRIDVQFQIKRTTPAEIPDIVRELRKATAQIADAAWVHEIYSMEDGLSLSYDDMKEMDIDPWLEHTP